MEFIQYRMDKDMKEEQSERNRKGRPCVLEEREVQRRHGEREGRRRNEKGEKTRRGTLRWVRSGFDPVASRGN